MWTIDLGCMIYCEREVLPADAAMPVWTGTGLTGGKLLGHIALGNQRASR